MTDLTLDLLLRASSPGGPSCLSSVTRLRPAGGEHVAVAPAKFVRGRDSTYAYERRFLDGELRHTVMLDSKQSQLNRAESALDQARQDGHPTLSRLPHVEVTYGDGEDAAVFTDLVLPHRVYDAHVRAGMVDGVPTTQTETYRAVRDATPANARALFDVSPLTLALGGWDATRKSRQGRWRSALVGEIVGFLQSVGKDGDDRPEAGRRGGARVDPVGMQVNLDGVTMKAIAEDQREELSGKLYSKVVEDADKIKRGERASASRLGLGGIPPMLEQLGGVACAPILRTHVLSFATLRQMRFGAGPDGDIACRGLLAALALAGLARSDAELYLRANCDLIEAAPSEVSLDQRGGELLALTPLTVDAADGLLADALLHAEQQAGVSWQGRSMAVVGNPDVVRGAEDEDTGAS